MSTDIQLDTIGNILPSDGGKFVGSRDDGWAGGPLDQMRIMNVTSNEPGREPTFADRGVKLVSRDPWP
jgi:hypothetical protein